MIKHTANAIVFACFTGIFFITAGLIGAAIGWAITTVIPLFI